MHQRVCSPSGQPIWGDWKNIGRTNGTPQKRGIQNEHGKPRFDDDDDDDDDDDLNS